MLRRSRQLRAQLSQVKHACLFGIALWLAYYVRTQWNWDLFGRQRTVESFEDYLWLYLLVIPAAPLVLASQGFYKLPLLARRWEVAWLLFKSCALLTFASILVLFLFKQSPARAVPFLFGALGFVLIFLHEQLMRSVHRKQLGQPNLRRRFVLIGGQGDTQLLHREVKESPEVGMDIVAELDLSKCSVESLVNLLHTHSVNGVIINVRHAQFDTVEKVVQVCELEGVEAWLVADFFKTQISRKAFDEFQGRPMLVFHSAPEASWQGVAKQFIDVVVALVLLLLLSLPFLIVAALIRLTSPGPVFFRQERCGLNGQPFTMLKFRSMASDAEQRQHELAAMNEMAGPVFKVTNDPRITPIGRFLRRWSIDELPQLINVLRVEMSLVGPRPLPVDEVRRFDDLAHRRRLSVKPGMTCLWQVSGRNEVRDFKDWVRLDLEYIDNWSIWLDLKILFRTIPVVLTGAGAK